MRWRVQAPMGRWVDLGDQVQMPERFTITGHDPKGVQPSFRAEFAVIDQMPQCREIHVVSGESGRRITLGDIRELNLERMIEYAAARLAQPYKIIDGVKVAIWDESAETIEQAVQAMRGALSSARRRRLTPQVLREVARVYRENVDNNPTKAVEDHFGLPNPRAARYWVKRAREAGELGASIPGKAGER